MEERTVTFISIVHVLKMETSKNRTHIDNEYFEEVIKIENNYEEKYISNFTSHLCHICQKVSKTRSALAMHYSSTHKDMVSSPWSMK